MSQKPENGCINAYVMSPNIVEKVGCKTVFNGLY